MSGSSHTQAACGGEAEQARQALAAVGAHCAVLSRTARDAQERAAGVYAGVPGLLAAGDL